MLMIFMVDPSCRFYEIADNMKFNFVVLLCHIHFGRCETSISVTKREKYSVIEMIFLS